MSSNRNQARPPPHGQPPAKRPKPGTGGVTRLSLRELVPGCFGANPSNTVFKGKIVFLAPYNAGTRIATITLQSVDEDGAKKVVQFKGNWVKQLMGELGKDWQGKLVSLAGRDARIKEHKGKEGGMREYRVEYEKGVSGVAEDKDGNRVTLSNGYLNSHDPKPTSQERVALASQSSSNPSSNSNPTPNPSAPTPDQDVDMTDLRNPVVASVSATKENESARRSASRGAGAAIPKAPVEVVPAPVAVVTGSLDQAAKKKAAEARFAQQAAAKTKEARTSAAAGQGVRALKAKKKEEEERKGWGLKTAKVEYSRLVDLGAGGRVNVIALAGVKTPIGPIARSKTGDWGTTLQLYDPSNPSTSQFTSANFFSPNAAKLPHVHDGDIVLLVQMNYKAGDPQLVGYKNTYSFAIFKPADLLAHTVQPRTSRLDKPHAAYGTEEIEYATRIAEWYQRQESQIALEENKNVDEGVKDTRSAAERSAEVWKNRKGGNARRLVEWKDCAEADFVDMVAEVVRTYKNHRALELYVTDYTSNEDALIYEPQQPNGVAQVSGQRQIQISLFDKQMQPAMDPNFGPGKLVHLGNVRIKKDGNGFLVGTMVDDPKYPDKREVTVIRPDNPMWTKQIASLMDRRVEYWEGEVVDEGVPGNDRSAPVAPIFNKPVAAAATMATASQTPKRGGVVCDFLEQKRVPIAWVLDPNNNVDGYWRLRGRIIDYLPARLEDWVRASCPDCQTILAPQLKTCLDHGKVKLDFVFHLSIEDAPTDDNPEPEDSMIVTVAYEDAVTVLPDLPPTADMRTGVADLDKLRRRFSSVLGKIEERKRRRQEVNDEHVGEYFDFAVSAIRKEGKYQYRFQGTSFS